MAELQLTPMARLICNRCRDSSQWSGRQDSNLRSPAPKAGALATTLRPG